MWNCCEGNYPAISQQDQMLGADTRLWAVAQGHLFKSEFLDFTVQGVTGDPQ